MSFQSSLQPMLVWMRCVGVFLESPSQESQKSSSRYLIVSLGFLIFFFNVFFNGMFVAGFILYFLSPQSSKFYRQISPATVLNTFISMANRVFLTFFSQFFLMYTTATNRWKNLVQILNSMEKEHQFKKEDYRKFHSIFFLGSVFLFLGILILFSILIFPFWAENEPVTAKIFHTGTIALFLYVFTGSVLFTCLCWMASDMLIIVAERVEQAKNYDGIVDWKILIDSLKHQHYRIFQYIDRINHCFGPFLLVLISSIFVTTVNSSFNIMQEIDGANKARFVVSNVTLIIIQFLNFAFLIFAPHRMRESALHLNKQLRTLQISNDALRNKINFLILEALHSLPKITVLGLFQVDLRLIPTFVGTSLTYLIILCQFQYSEKND